MTENRKSTFDSKLLELFSATLGLSPAANSMADMLHQTSHSPPTPGRQYRTTTAVNSSSSYLSYTQRRRRGKRKRDTVRDKLFSN